MATGQVAGGKGVGGDPAVGGDAPDPAEPVEAVAGSSVLQAAAIAGTIVALGDSPPA